MNYELLVMKKMNKFGVCITMVMIFACGGQGEKFDASGLFEATEVVVSAQASGAIMEFAIEEGALLKEGYRFGFIDTVPLYLKKLQLEASIQAVESRKTDISKQIAAIKEQIATQKRELQRFENLVGANAANQKQVDDISASIHILEKQLAAQTELLQNSNRNITQERLVLEVQVAQIEDQLNKCIISSPISGTVLTKYAERGEFAVPSKALFKVADLSQIFLRAYITSSQLTQIKLGQKAAVTADFGEKGNRSYEGVVNWISNQSEFTPKNIQTRSERDNLVYAIKIAVQNDGYLKIGMYGEVKF